MCGGLGLGCACTPPILAAVLGCVCLCLRSASTTPFLAGVCVACNRARSFGLPRHLWLWCVGWLCVCGFGFWLQPVIPGCSVGVCVFVCTLRLYPAFPARGVRCSCVCLGSGFHCAVPFLAGMLKCVCLFARPACTLPILAGVRGTYVLVRFLAFMPPILAEVLGHLCLSARSACTPLFLLSRVQCGCVCVGSGFGCALPFLARVLVCVCVCAVLLYPANPGRGLWRVCLVSGSGFHPPILAGVLGCVYLFARPACTPPILAWV